MIKSKQEYREYLRCDKIALFGDKFRTHIYPAPWGYTWKYLRALRKSEYFLNCKKGPLKTIWCLFLRIKRSRLSVKTGITIPPNTFGKGLGLFHYGAIIVNNTAKFGDWCVIQCGVNISENVNGGDFIYLAPGCKVNKDIHIADHIIVGSNAVVTKDINESGITVGGVPAKKISGKGFYNVMKLSSEDLASYISL